MINQLGIKKFLNIDNKKFYETIDSLAQDTNGSIYLDEIHLYYHSINTSDISLVSKEEIQQAGLLLDGPWKDYLQM